MKENMRTGNLPANMKKARVIQIIPCKAVSMGPQVLNHPPLNTMLGSEGLWVQFWALGSCVQCQEERTLLGHSGNLQRP